MLHFRSATRLAILATLASTNTVGMAQTDTVPATQTHITIGRQTTFLTSPIRRDGFVDYRRGLNKLASEGVTPENNAAVLFWQAWGPGEVESELLHELFDELQIPIPPEKGDYFVTLGAMARSLSLPTSQDNALFEQHDESTQRPWQRGEFPLVATWLDKNEAPLRLLTQGCQRSRYYSPLLVTPEDAPLISCALPELQLLRGAARALSARAMLHAGEDRPQAAWLDVLTCLKLAQLAGERPTIIGQLVAIAIDAIGSSTAARLVVSNTLDADQLARCMKDVQSLTTKFDIADSVDRTERLISLDAIAFLSRTGADGFRDFGLEVSDGAASGVAMSDLLSSLLSQAAIDWNHILLTTNREYNRMVRVMRFKTFKQRVKSFEKLNQAFKTRISEARKPANLAKSLISRQARSETLASVLMAILVPAIQQVKEAENRYVTKRELLKILIALELYKHEHQEFPAGLDALQPKYLPQVANDLYTEAPLIYRVTNAGFQLYSLGPNGRDDGGILERDADDISLLPKPTKE